MYTFTGASTNTKSYMIVKLPATSLALIWGKIHGNFMPSSVNGLSLSKTIRIYKLEL